MSLPQRESREKLKRKEIIMFKQMTLFLSVLMFIVSVCWEGNASGASQPGLDNPKADSKKGLVLVAGATGRTGRLVVKTLLEKNYQVRAFVRDVKRATELLGPNVEYIKGDVRNIDSIGPAMQGVARIISAVGAFGKEANNGPEDVDYGGVKNLVNAASAANIDQFVLISSTGVTNEDHILNKKYDNILIWKFKGEEVLRKSGVAYTIVRPGGLTDDEGGRQEVLFKQGDTGQGLVTRADVAQVCVAALEIPEARNKTLEIINGNNPPSKDWQTLFSVLKPD
jgi:uncharacterized protein YbjT (DUF2867 family)